MQDFHSFGLPNALVQSLDQLNFKTPTPIQQAAIPLVMDGKDILGSAQTGTGKTGAFGIPLLAKMILNTEEAALIIAPTRELATQVMKSLQSMLWKGSPVKTALLIGGESMQAQLHQLKRNPRLFVGTPGRINDHLKRGSLKLSAVRYLVLDEMDRMLDMGFSIQIADIKKHLPKDLQTLLFSATLPKEILKLAESYLKNPERISIGSTTNPAEKIKQEVVHMAEPEKYPRLLNELDDRKGSIIIFVKTKINAERMAKKLRDANHDTDALHGDLRHNKRERVIHAFRKQKYRILVATDVAARGLDIPHIEHVINYDLPQAPEDYIHRIGRTARAGAEGEAICFVAPADRGKWKAIHRLMNPGAAAEEGPRRGFGNGPRRDRRSDRSRFEKRSDGFGKKSFGSRDRNDRSSRGDGHFKGEKFSRHDRSPRDEKPSWERRDRPSRDAKPFGKKHASDKGSFNREGRPGGRNNRPAKQGHTPKSFAKKRG
jgi:ATP-dependent RNA helicase DeaD